jgi:hypothetical protein
MAFILRNDNKDQIAEIMALYNGSDKGAEGFETAKSDNIHHLCRMIGDFHSVYDTASFNKIYDNIETWEEFIKI